MKDYCDKCYVFQRRLINKMSPVYEVIFQGQPAVIKKGSVEPIKIDVVQRASNKKV